MRPLNTLDLLASSFSAAMTYKTRAAIGFTREFGIRFRLTEIPVDYSVTNFVYFQPAVMRSLFKFSDVCAAEHRVWLTPKESIYRNAHPWVLAPDTAPKCPAATGILG